MSMKNNNIDPRETENEEWADEVLRYLKKMDERLKNIEEQINVRGIDSRVDAAVKEAELNDIALDRFLDEYPENYLDDYEMK